MNNIKSNLKGVVGSSSSGIPLNRLENDYHTITNSTMDYRAHGFSTLRKFLESVPDVVEVALEGKQWVAKIACSKDESNSVKNIVDLVQNTKGKQKKPVYQYKKEPQTKASQHEPLELFRISVPNNFYKSKMQVYSPKEVQVKKSSANSPKEMDKENRYKANGVDKTLSEDIADSGSWFVKPTITFEPLQRRVTVLGIQSGHAVVVGSGKPLRPLLMGATCVEVAYAGDMLLWQPPFKDSLRPGNAVDIFTVFPVILIKQSCTQRMQARLMGLSIILEVALKDLFEMPTCGKSLLRMVKMIKSREVSVVCLALIPRATDIWDKASLAGEYCVLLSIEEGGSILESNDKRGLFLNLSLLSLLAAELTQTKDEEEKSLFLKHAKYCLERAMVALCPTYQKVTSQMTDMHPESLPLRKAYTTGEYSEKMLLASKRLLAPPTSDSHQLSGDGLSLQRMKFWDNKTSFYSFDDQSPDVAVLGKAPPAGLLIVNEAFVTSAVTQSDPMRFKTALLLTLPSIIDLSLDLGLSVEPAGPARQ